MTTYSKHPLPQDVARLPRGAWLRSEPWAPQTLRQLIVSWAAELRVTGGWARFEVEETTTDLSVSRRTPPGPWTHTEGPRTLEEGWRADRGTAVLVVRFWAPEAELPAESSVMLPDGARTTLQAMGERLLQLEAAIAAIP